MDESSLVASHEEYLDPGYDAQTSDGDNLLLDFSRAERQMWTSWGRSADAHIGDEADTGMLWVDSGSATVFGNPVLWTRPMDDEAAEKAVARLTREFAGRSGAPYLLYSTFPTPDLRSLGLKPVGHPPCMVRMPGVPTADGRRADLTIERVDSADFLDDFERTFLEAYPVTELLPWERGLFSSFRWLSDPKLNLFVGYVDGKPVATAGAYVTGHIVDVTLVSTRPESRGRGFGRAITQAAVDAAPSLPAMLLASDDGQAVYKAMGFRTLTRYTLWIGFRG